MLKNKCKASTEELSFPLLSRETDNLLFLRGLFSRYLKFLEQMPALIADISLSVLCFDSLSAAFWALHNNTLLVGTINKKFRINVIRV